MTIYKRDPNKDYKIKITLSELDDSSAVSAQVNYSQMKEMMRIHNLDSYTIMTDAVIVELEKIEAKNLGQEYYDSWQQQEKKEEDNKNLTQE